MRSKKGIARIRTAKHTAKDVDLENRIARFLHQRHVPNGQRIHADARLGTVIVSGHVPSRHAKWLCIECCRHVAGVIKLVDNVVVTTEVRQQKQPLEAVVRRMV